jgi:hypothetical protein
VGWVFGSTKHRNRALWGRFVRLVGYRFDSYPEFSYSLGSGILRSSTVKSCRGPFVDAPIFGGS